MRLQNYINESRSKKISEKKLKNIIPDYINNIKIGLKNGISIVRQAKGYTDLFYILNPKTKKLRRSVSTSNYYTLIIDNSNKWVEYPKRSQSLICLTNDINSTSRNLWIIPKDNTRVGQCIKDDIWWSFPNVYKSKKSGIQDGMSDFNNSFEVLLNLPFFTDEDIEKYNIYKEKSFDKNFNTLISGCKKFDKWFNNITIFDLKELKNILVKTYAMDFMKKWNGEPLYDFINELLDPNKNKFKLVKTNKLSKNREVWTDDQCLIINIDHIDSVDKLKAIVKNLGY